MAGLGLASPNGFWEFWGGWDGCGSLASGSKIPQIPKECPSDFAPKMKGMDLAIFLARGKALEKTSSTWFGLGHFEDFFVFWGGFGCGLGLEG